MYFKSSVAVRFLLPVYDLYVHRYFRKLDNVQDEVFFKKRADHPIQYNISEFRPSSQFGVCYTFELELGFRCC